MFEFYFKIIARYLLVIYLESSCKNFDWLVVYKLSKKICEYKHVFRRVQEFQLIRTAALWPFMIDFNNFKYLPNRYRMAIYNDQFLNISTISYITRINQDKNMLIEGRIKSALMLGRKGPIHSIKNIKYFYILMRWLSG